MIFYGVQNVNVNFKCFKHNYADTLNVELLISFDLSFACLIKKQISDIWFYWCYPAITYTFVHVI